jgi:threonine synthase
MEKLVCPACGGTYGIEPRRWRCECGSFLDLEFIPWFDVEKIRNRRPTLWRYREALPILRDEHIVSLGEGCTPLVEMEVDGHPVFIKVDYLFPSGSYKDRGATVLISKAKELGVRQVIEDSSGNAGCAVAAYCTRAALGCEIYVPGSTSAGKLVQIEAYGARLNKVEGSREKTAQVTMESADRTFYASHCWNPFFLHGTKTFAFEICEQMGWKAPEVLVLPVGHGTLFLGAYLGFRELLEAGIVNRIPKLIAVQAAACAPVVQAFDSHQPDVSPIDMRETVAEGIAIARPVRGRQILEALRETGGEAWGVTEEEIREGLEEMGRKGYFIEPTSAATIAGLKKCLERFKNSSVVSTLTGTGLKATEKIGQLKSDFLQP